MEQEIVRELEKLNKFEYINSTEIKLIQQVWDELKDEDSLHEILLGYCLAKEEGCRTFDEIIEWLAEKWNIPDESYMYLNFDYDGNYIPDEEYELYWKYTKDI